MLTYVYLGTNDLPRATQFCDAILAPLGMQRSVTGDADWDRVSAGWGIYEADGARELALWVGKPFDQQPATTGNGTMVAWKAVDEFHAAALKLGGVSVPKGRMRRTPLHGCSGRTAARQDAGAWRPGPAHALQPGLLWGVCA
jgi:hypothetical protein